MELIYRPGGVFGIWFNHRCDEPAPYFLEHFPTVAIARQALVERRMHSDVQHCPTYYVKHDDERPEWEVFHSVSPYSQILLTDETGRRPWGVMYFTNGINFQVGFASYEEFRL